VKVHPYIGLRATSTPYELWPALTVPSVTGTVAGVTESEALLLLDDGRHTTRRMTSLVMADPTEAAARLKAAS